jgi:hypothetical protein
MTVEGVRSLCMLCASQLVIRPQTSMECRIVHFVSRMLTVAHSLFVGWWMGRKESGTGKVSCILPEIVVNELFALRVGGWDGMLCRKRFGCWIGWRFDVW